MTLSAPTIGQGLCLCYSLNPPEALPPPQLTEEKTEAQRGQVITQGHTAKKWQNWDSNPALIPKPLLAVLTPMARQNTTAPSAWGSPSEP